MKHHTITVDEVSEYLVSHWVEFAGSFGERSNKIFEISLDGQYRVSDHREIVYQGRDKFTAVDTYNSRR